MEKINTVLNWVSVGTGLTKGLISVITNSRGDDLAFKRIAAEDKPKVDKLGHECRELVAVGNAATNTATVSHAIAFITDLCTQEDDNPLVTTGYAVSIISDVIGIGTEIARNIKLGQVKKLTKKFENTKEVK